MELNKGILSKSLAIIVPAVGTELGPLTRHRPQPLLPFGRDSRIIDFTILNCRKSGLRKAFVLAPRQAHAIANHLESSGSGMNLVTLRPDASVSCRSSVDLLFQSIDLLRVEEPEYVLVLLTDHVYEMDYQKLMQLHIKNGAQITIVTNGIADVGVYVFNTEMFRRVMLIASLTDHDVIGRTAILRAADPQNICSYDFTI